MDNEETVNRGQESKFGITNFYVIHRKGEVDFFFKPLHFLDAFLENVAF